MTDDPGIDGLSEEPPLFVEWAFPKVAGAVFAMNDIILRRQTPFQDLLLFHNPFWGKVLVLDGAVQLTERDEFFYHESLAHPPLLTVENPKNILIIGGGDGGLAEEVLKHPVQKVTLVDIDPEVVQIARAHLASVHKNAFNDSRLQIDIADANRWIRESTDTYDVILMDVTDPAGPSESLFSRDTLRVIAEHLSPEGALALQFGRYFDPPPLLNALEPDLRQLFAWSTVYAAPVPAYPTGVWRFFLGSRHLPQRNPEVVGLRLASLPDLRYLSPAFRFPLAHPA
ncbi:MAG: fused MFS/spermidine synthase [bacterium JZ-2024 1]